MRHHLNIFLYFQLFLSPETQAGNLYYSSKDKMDQFRQIGEVLGSLKALMVLKHEIPINQRQCCLLFDMFNLAFETIAEEISQNLKLEEKNTKWKSLEHPMKELHRIFKESEVYIRTCLDTKDWWGKVIIFHNNKDCVEYHIHNLLCCFPVVIEAIETAAETSGINQDDMQKRRHMILRKYDSEWNDTKLFQWMFGKQYLVPRDICSRLDNAWKEDRWTLLETIKERKTSASKLKHEQILGELLIKKLNGSDVSNTKLMPSLALVGAKDYSVKRRLGSGGSRFKEIHWLGDNFALRTFFGDIEPLNGEISLMLSLSHPNIMQYLCGFYDEEKKEGFLVMELMSKDLCTYIKENCGQRKRIPFSVPVAVDIMLQIARGMEYLHSRKIYHGNLNPSSVLLRARNSSVEGYFHAKVTGFGLNSVKSYGPRGSPNQNGIDPVIWSAPEVLAEQENSGEKSSSKYTEKADVYSFGMLCFELLTGKVPFEDGHLQGDKMVRNIRAGERPLFPHPSPKFLSNLTRRCWHTNPVHRPSFSSICRILRYIKKILVINPDHGEPEAPPPLVDYCDIEAGYLKKFSGERNSDLAPVSQIPFQLFSYRLLEKEKTSASFKDKSWDLVNECSIDEQMGLMDDFFLVPSDGRSVCSEIIESKKSTVTDQRSVVSEIPQRKLLSANQKTFFCESPRRNFSSVTQQGDQSPVWAESKEREFSFMLPGDQKSTFAETPEMKVSSTKTDKKPISFDIPKVKLLRCNSENLLKKVTSPTGADRRTLWRENSLKEASSRATELVEKKTLVPIKTNRKLSIPEKKVESTTPTTPKVVCSVIPEKKVVVPTTPTTTKEKKVVFPTTPTAPKEKKVSLTKRMKDAKNKIIPC